MHFADRKAFHSIGFPSRGGSKEFEKIWIKIYFQSEPLQSKNVQFKRKQNTEHPSKEPCCTSKSSTRRIKQEGIQKGMWVRGERGSRTLGGEAGFAKRICGSVFTLHGSYICRVSGKIIPYINVTKVFHQRYDLLKKGKVGGLEVEGGSAAPGGKNWNKRREGVKGGEIPEERAPRLKNKKDSKEELLQELKTRCGESRLEGKRVDMDDGGGKASTKDSPTEEREIILKVEGAVVEAAKPAIYIVDLGVQAGKAVSNTKETLEEQNQKRNNIKVKPTKPSQKRETTITQTRNKTPTQIIKNKEKKMETKRDSSYNQHEDKTKVVGKLEKAKIERESERNIENTEETCVGFSTSLLGDEKNSLEITSDSESVTDINKKKTQKCDQTTSKDCSKIGSISIDSSSNDDGKDLDQSMDTIEVKDRKELLTRNGKLLEHKSLLEKPDHIISNAVPAIREEPSMSEDRVVLGAPKETKVLHETEKNKEKEKEEGMGLLEHKLVLEGAREARLSNELDKMKRSRKAAMSQVL